MFTDFIVLIKVAPPFNQIFSTLCLCLKRDLRQRLVSAHHEDLTVGSQPPGTKGNEEAAMLELTGGSTSALLQLPLCLPAVLVVLLSLRRAEPSWGSSF